MQREFHYEVDGQLVTVSITIEDGTYMVAVGEHTYTVEARQGDRGRLDVAVAGRRIRAHVAADRDAAYVGLDGQTWTLPKADPRRRQRMPGTDTPGTLRAGMPGLVLDVLVTEGEPVARGDTLVLMEAMKMEIRLTAPLDGTVRHVHCHAGEVVARGHLLLELEQKDNE
jgi:3-methylcrotonyl-CoA carboxylase alpha subunit